MNGVFSQMFSFHFIFDKVVNFLVISEMDEYNSFSIFQVTNYHGMLEGKLILNFSSLLTFTTFFVQVKKFH